MLGKTFNFDQKLSHCSSWRLSSLLFFVVFFFFLQIHNVLSEHRANSSKTSTPPTHLCYTCMEPLIGFTDYSDSCKYLNISSPLAASFIKTCPSSSSNSIDEYECRKVVVSYRSVETYLRRDCVRKGQCSWKDRSQAMVKTPVSNCVYTDERSHKLECIYCCSEPLCNGSMSKSSSIVVRFFIFILLYLQ